GRPRAKPRLRQALERLDVPPHDAADGVFGGVVVLADERFDLLDQSRILDEEGVSAKNGAVLLAELGTDGVLVGACFLGGGFEGLAQAGNFLLALFFFDEALGNAEPLGVDHQGWPNGDAGRYRDAAFDFHLPRYSSTDVFASMSRRAVIASSA